MQEKAARGAVAAEGGRGEKVSAEAPGASSGGRTVRPEAAAELGGRREPCRGRPHARKR